MNETCYGCLNRKDEYCIIQEFYVESETLACEDYNENVNQIFNDIYFEFVYK